MNSLALRLESKISSEIALISNNKLIAITIIFLTAVVAFSVPESTPLIFITAVPVLILQVFATSHYYKLLKSNQLLRNSRYGIKTNEAFIPVVSAISFAIRDGYFFIFLSFDIIWLMSAYISPIPAASFNAYLQRLMIGPIDGTGFLIFTGVFWYVYLIFFLMPTEEEIAEIRSDEEKDVNRIPFTIPILNYKGEKIFLNGFRMYNPGKQPLILWPGFYQNGLFYDLNSEGENSLAELLWKEGYDIWIFHPRGTAYSGFAEKINSLDDYSCEDIPSIIQFVYKSTRENPIFIGHSQGGITALMSMMGICKNKEGKLSLSDENAIKRQELLKGLITLGSYPDFTFDKPAMAQTLANEGIKLNIGEKPMTIVSSETLLWLIKKFNRVPVPVPLQLREAIIRSKFLRILLFPISLLLNFIASLKIWQFLYNIPNVSKASRRHLFYRTINASFSGIISQFRYAVVNGRMLSSDQTINYSENYYRIRLPVVIVTMEDDSLAHPSEARKNMFEKISSESKYFVEWKQQGHEDFVMNPQFYRQLLDAIKQIDK